MDNNDADVPSKFQVRGKERMGNKTRVFLESSAISHINEPTSNWWCEGKEHVVAVVPL
jgi:hypothetical protein